AGADLVPELRDHHRRAVILADDDLQAIVEAEFVGRLGLGGEGRQGHAERAEKQAGAAAGESFHRGLLTCRAARPVVPPAGEEVLGYRILFRGGAATRAAPLRSSDPCLVPTTTRSRQPRLASRRSSPARRNPCSAGCARNRRKPSRRPPSRNPSLQPKRLPRPSPQLLRRPSRA